MKPEWTDLPLRPVRRKFPHRLARTGAAQEAPRMGFPQRLARKGCPPRQVLTGLPAAGADARF
ncbi:hypothetical protein ACLESD_52990, partial [Pyxidicoccus sp. 3LFB2]